MIKNIHNSEKEKSFGSAAREVLSQKNGSHATFYYTNGDQYLGEWKSGCREGKGTQRCKKGGQVYMGEWKNDMRDGHGVLSIPEDSKVNSKNYNTSKMLKVYVGNWRNDKKDGLGTFSYPDSSLYEGQWSSDYRQGWGKMSYPDGSIYEGEWYGGKRHGNGTLLLPNGDKYDGLWSDNAKEGPGRFTYFSKRQCYTGEWYKGQARCGTIHNLPPLPGQIGTKYQIPIIGLEDPQGVLEAERGLISESRTKRAVS